MQYCPHCSHVLQKPVKVCPYCKKTVDYQILAAVYQDRNSSKKNRKKLWKIWIKEHENIFMLAGGALLGVIIGIISFSGYSKVQFDNERGGYIEKIAKLESVINKRNEEAGDAINNYQKQLVKKNEMIKILTEQKKGLASIIRTTRALAENGTFTPNTEELVVDYQNNMRNLKFQFYSLEEKLKEIANDSGSSSYNLNAIPQLLEE